MRADADTTFKKLPYRTLLGKVMKKTVRNCPRRPKHFRCRSTMRWKSRRERTLAVSQRRGRSHWSTECCKPPARAKCIASAANAAVAIALGPHRTLVHFCCSRVTYCCREQGNLQGFRQIGSHIGTAHRQCQATERG